VLVKTISKESLGRELEDDLLFLHDEIWRLIDKSGTRATWASRISS
jgi:hypothetical protein